MLEQIESNRRRSAMIVVVMGVLLVVVGLSLGMFFTGDQEGAILGGAVALAVWMVMWLYARFQGDNALLQMAGAREIAKGDHPQLFNIVEEMTIAAQLAAHAAGVYCRRSRAECVCRRARSEQSRRGGDDWPAAAHESR